jgi:hypothetical protein
MVFCQRRLDRRFLSQRHQLAGADVGEVARLRCDRRCFPSLATGLARDALGV